MTWHIISVIYTYQCDYVLLSKIETLYILLSAISFHMKLYIFYYQRMHSHLYEFVVCAVQLYLIYSLHPISHIVLS
jgi:hypothetical protein